MSTAQDFLFEEITEHLPKLSDKQVIRVEQKEREDERIAIASGC